MIVERCFHSLCFAPLNDNTPRFFGFAEYLVALALMILAWTNGDVRYRFRVQTAFLPIRGVTFTIVSIVGVLSLATDWWRAEHWPVPVGHVFTPAGWQAFLGGLFLFSFLLWSWFAFIRPQNAGRSGVLQK